MLIVALPAELLTNFHHAQLTLGGNSVIFYHQFDFQAQVSKSSNSFFKVAAHAALPHRSEAGVAHSASEVGFAAGAHWWASLATISDVCIKIRCGPLADEKSEMIDPPSLRRFIKSHSPSRNARSSVMKNPVGQIVSSGSRRVVTCKMNFLCCSLSKRP